MTVKAGAIFNLLALSWTKDDPVLFSEGVGYGRPVRDEPRLDFAGSTEDEWRRMVTPNLQIKQRLH